MEKLKKAYEAVEMLRALDLPISSEQLQAIATMEQEYLAQEVIPLVKQEMEPLVEKMQGEFHLSVDFTPEDGLSIEIVEDDEEEESPDRPVSTRTRQKKFIVKVTSEDGQFCSCNQYVKDTLIDVVKYAGLEEVYGLKIATRGTYLVEKALDPNPQTASYQQEIADGYFMVVNSNSFDKADQMREISERLNLGLKVELVDYKTNKPISQEKPATADQGHRKTYSLEGGIFQNKGRFVRDVIIRYMKEHPLFTYAELEANLPKRAHGNKFILTREEWLTRGDDSQRRYLNSDEDMLVSSDGIEFYVSNQFTDEVFDTSVIPFLRKVGYNWEER